ncbi:LysE family translocator [Sulfurospirillum arcachonense]|uniref:LysE family translocator n=1 Tax=Sulfurospirillum arcachonense TaxID=57666 RepID=UPI000468A6D9|nr:LysE family translocator [Sulfurospirillum arcachonense]
MNMETILSCVITLLPITISPGPANILFAASGSSFGIKNSLPFWLSTNSVCILQTLSIGFGLDFILKNYPHTIEIIHYIGVAFLLYLAFKFYNLSISSKDDIKPLTFTDGLVVEFLNVKYLIIPTIMFSQFYQPTDGYSQIILLSILLAVLTMTSNIIWIIGGKSLALFVSQKNMQKKQGIIFGSLLLITAIWLAIN